ncbi:MAG: radical SAM family heme chaperone HemW [Myxococcota bacterium]
MASDSVGVYVHVPFCERVCPYCDFAVVAARPLEPSVEARYVEALVRELALRAGPFDGLALASVYLGGGTPSLLSVASVERIVGAVRERFAARVGAAPEITLEVNPSTLERARLGGFRAAGVNRLSIGVQSFDDAMLKRLGRAHRARDAHATLSAARAAGFENVSLDLIVGGPGATRAQLDRDLDAVAAFAPEHVSTYELTVEEGTPFALAERRGQLARPDERAVVAALARVDARLAAAGLERYEVSSHARPGFESAHNRRYWRRAPVLGLGVGAWSTLPPTAAHPHGGRAANARSLGAHLDRVEGARAAAGSIADAEWHDAATARGEAVFLALREPRGLGAAGFAREFGAPPRAFFAREIDELVGLGLLDEDAAGDLRLSARGRWLADSVAERFV